VAQVGAAEVGAGQICLAQIHVAQVGAAQIRSGATGAGHYRATVDGLDIFFSQVGALGLQLRAAEGE